MILEFKGPFSFLSNFYPSSIVYDGIDYPTVEHFYQAMKTTNLEMRETIANAPTPGQAKRMGNKVELRADWEDIKVGVMAYGLYWKFTQHPELGNKLISTAPKKLVEGNYWNDKFWGYCLKTDEGENMLGSLLMHLRNDFLREC